MAEWGLLARASIAWLCAAGVANAEARLRFEHLTVEDGLANNWVQAVLRDSRGFLWIGTRGGLDRYDGRTFVHYRHSPDDPQTIPGAQVAVLYEDGQGTLWLGSGFRAGGGLARYDRGTDRFVRLPHGAGSSGLSGSSVSAILEDRRQRLWVGTEEGLNLLDRQRGTFESYAPPAPASGTAASGVYALADDGRDGIWVGTRRGLFRFDPGQKRFTAWADHKGDSRGLDRMMVIDILADESGVLWIGTLLSGLFRLDPRSAEVTHFRPRIEDPRSLSLSRVRCLAMDSQGRVWIGTDGAGLSVWSPRTNSFRRYVPDVEDAHSLSSSSIQALHVDHQGIVWIGTYNGGLDSVLPLGRSIEHIAARRGGLSDSHVASILEDASGNLWVGTDGGGLNRVDRQTGRYTYYRHDPKQPATLAGNAVHAILEDSAGAIWVGGWASGLGRLDRRTGRVTRFLHDPRNPASNAADSVWRILELKSGELLVANQDGVELFDRKAATFTRLQARYPQATPARTFAAAEDARRNLWLGGEGSLLYVDRSSGSVRTYGHDPADSQGLGRGIVSTIWIDSRDNVWIGTETGLNCVPAAGGPLRRYTTADGMPHDVVTNILEDSSGSLWLTTNRGLSKLVDAVRVPDHPRFLNFDVHDGLQGQEFTRGAAFASRSGRLYFGGSRGLNAFFPQDVRQNLQPPPVVITDLKLFNRSQAPGAAGSPLLKAMAETSELTLSYEQSVVTLEFAALNLILPQKNAYAYMLEGIDREWNRVGSRNMATYTHIPSGIHAFRVRASNNDGVWNDDGAVLRIRVTPPPWQTWWFRLLAALGVAAGVVLTVHLRVRRLRTQAQRLAGTVAERTRELRVLNEELEQRVAARTRELEAEKERLAVTLRSIGDGVVATDVSGRVLLLNRVAERLMGWTLGEAEGRLLGDVFRLLRPESRQPHPDPVDLALSGRGTPDLLPSESLLVQRGGGELRVASSVAPIRDRESRIVGVVLVFRDVTERHRVEEQLQTAQKLEALGILAGGIAHDFNNLLTGVFGYIDLAHRRSADPQKTRDTLDRALSVMRKARGLTAQLLTFSRAGQPVTGPLDLTELLRSSARFAMSGSNVICEVETPPDLWSCEGDERQIDQVIDNLLVNARQAMPQGGRIQLVAENVVVPEGTAVPVAGRFVRVTVRDQGPGIPAEIRGRIFEPFFTTKPTGTGLGLATAYSIVRKHGGHIALESNVGAGASFSVYLPASAVPARPEAPAAPEAVSGRGRILVLDDEEYVREVAQESLQELGFSVVTVSTGEEAVARYRDSCSSGCPFDLVILDLTIPGGMGGAAVLSRLRALDPTVCAIASSGYSGDSAMADPEAHGFRDRLIKPYTSAEIGAVVWRVLREPPEASPRPGI